MGSKEKMEEFKKKMEGLKEEKKKRRKRGASAAACFLAGDEKKKGAITIPTHEQGADVAAPIKLCSSGVRPVPGCNSQLEPY